MLFLALAVCVSIKLRCLLLLALLFTLVLAPMQVAAAPTPVPNPKPDISAMSYFTGTWTCHQMLRGKDRPDTSTSMMDLNDRWIKTTDVAPVFDSYRTSPVNSTTYTTYDGAVKRYVQVNVDDFGGYGIAYSTGWKGNTMVWTDKSASDGAVAMTTITKLSDSEYNWKFEGTMGNGKPQEPQHGTCKKAG
jgi:hypothetical protein